MNNESAANILVGLHYPASDIPPQARELYKINRTRILYDREAETARLVSTAQSRPQLSLGALSRKDHQDSYLTQFLGYSK